MVHIARGKADLAINKTLLATPTASVELFRTITLNNVKRLLIFVQDKVQLVSVG